MVDKAALGAYAGYVLEDATIPELPNHYRGKVRDNYDLPDGRRIIIASDRISAFDRNLAAIPLKGQVLTQTAKFWFEAVGVWAFSAYWYIKTREIDPTVSWVPFRRRQA